jgi:hypothetical protein
MPKSSAYRKERRRAHRLAGRVIGVMESVDCETWWISLERRKGVERHCRETGRKSDCRDLAGFSNYAIDLTCGEVSVDYAKNPLGTIVHEFLHVLYPAKTDDWPTKAEEDEIGRKEQLVMRHLTPEQATRIWKAAARLM